MIIPPARLRQHQRVLREIEVISATFSFQKSVLGAPAVLESVLGKSCAIPVCLSESCLSHGVTRALCYCYNFVAEALGTKMNYPVRFL